MLLDEVIDDDAAADEMIVDDALEDRRIAAPIPRALGIDDRDRSTFADAQAIRLRAENAALLRQTEFLQPPLEKLPRGEPAFLLTAFRIGLIAAEKNVAPRNGHADALRD